jgi:hypothetical protein
MYLLVLKLKNDFNAKTDLLPKLGKQWSPIECKAKLSHFLQTFNHII